LRRSVFTDLCDSLRAGFVASCRGMKRLIPLLVLIAAPLVAEPVTLKQPALLRQDRNAMSLKAGTVVELISRDGNEITIKYRDLTGKIPASKLEEPKASSTTTSAPATKSGAVKKSEKKAAEAKPADESKPANPPQTTYGKMVKKAKDTVEAHDKNLVKPTNEAAKDATP
jgi:hypothetical protein